MITPSFGLTATERVLPKLALDFTTASLDPRVTFTRTTGASNPATYVNSNGIVTAATNNQPRFDYNPTTLACNGLLIEESRQNIALYSDSFGTVSAWSVFQTSISTDTTQSPDGTVNADSIIQNSTTNAHGLTGTIVVTSGTTYTWSVFAKADTSTVLQLTYGNASGTFSGVGYANFNLLTGVVSATGGTLVGSGIQNYGNGWYRCWIAATATASAATNNWIAIANSTTYTRLASYAGDNTSGFYIWGAQVEVGAFPTSYIPTTSAALTRNADVATMTGTNFSSWFNATQGSFVAQYNIPYNLASGTAQRIIDVIGSGGSGVDDILLFVLQSSGKAASGNVFTSSVNAGRMDVSSSFVANTTIKASYAFGTNARSLATNGVSPTTNNNAYTIPTVTYMRIGSDSNTLNVFNGWMQKINFYSQKLTNNEVQAFSK